MRCVASESKSFTVLSDLKRDASKEGFPLKIIHAAIVFALREVYVEASAYLV